MSVLTVVRHGQASFLAENYDRLSELGQRQAELLGRHWLERDVRFDVVVYGPCERQIRTGEIIAGMYRRAERHWPEPVEIGDFDEYPAERVVRTFLPALMHKHAPLAEAVAQFQSAQDRATKQRLFDRVLREVSERWLHGEVSSPEIPTWQDFCHRIESAVRGVLARCPKSTRATIFTSGGPTAATARIALNLSYRDTLNLTWSPRNSSYSEFLFSGERFSLSSFNNTPHLNAPDLLTYR